MKINLPPATTALIALILLAYAVSSLTDLTSLTLSPQLVQERPWTLVTHIFLHANPAHLLLNVFALFTFGILLEPELGTKKFLLLFFASGLAAGVGEVLIAEPEIHSLGASGAIFGIMGTLAALKPTSIVLVEFIPMPMILAATGYGISNLLLLKLQDGTAHPAHLFGLLLGLAYGLYLRLSQKPAETQNQIQDSQTHTRQQRPTSSNAHRPA